MPENPAQPVNLSWFYTLDLNERVALLDDPRQSLSLPFVQRIAAQVEQHGVKQQVIDEVRWSGTPVWTLEQRAAAPRLEEIRRELDVILRRDRDYLIEHHADLNPMRRPH